MAPFMLYGQEELNPIQMLIQKGLMYDLILKLEGKTDRKEVLDPLIISMETYGSNPVSPSPEPVRIEPSRIEPVRIEPLSFEAEIKPEVSLDYNSHLLERERVRKMIEETSQRNKETVSILTAAVEPLINLETPVRTSGLV
jgi:hypothetical protein